MTCCTTYEFQNHKTDREHHDGRSEGLQWNISPQVHPAGVSALLKDDVGDEHREAGRQEHNEELVDAQDVLQGVDPLLHGAGVEVIVHPGPNSPHHPHYVHDHLHPPALTHTYQHTLALQPGAPHPGGGAQVPGRKTAPLFHPVNHKSNIHINA